MSGSMQSQQGLGLNDQTLETLTYVHWLASQQEKVLRNVGLFQFVQPVSEGQPLQHASIPNVHDMYGLIVGLAVRRLWSIRKRTVYALHPQLVSELDDSTSGELPAEIFDRLPRPDPLIVFPQPLHVATPDGKVGHVIGFYVYGRLKVTGGALCSSGERERKGLGLLFLTRILDDQGHQIDIDVTRLTIPSGQGHFTVDDAVDNTLKAFASEPDMHYMPGRMQAWLTALTRAAVHVLLYLCSEDPDIAKRPASATRGVGLAKPADGGKTPKPVTLFNVGWQAGPALYEARRTSTAPQQPGFHTLWDTAHSGQSTVVFGHVSHRLDEHLDHTTTELETLRSTLQQAKEEAETQRAANIELTRNLAASEESAMRLSAARRRLTHHVLRLRAAAAAVGSPDHLEALQRQRRRSLDDLEAAHQVIDDLTRDLQHALDQLSRPRREHVPDEALLPSAPTTPAADIAAYPEDSSWEGILQAAESLPHLWMSPALGKIAAGLPTRPDWLRTTWNTLTSLSAYAQMRTQTRAAGGSLASLRNFRAYLLAETSGLKISAAQVAGFESDTVLGNSRLRAQRQFPVPSEVDSSPRALYVSHVRIGQTAPFPRLYFLDVAELDLICIGYLGPHLSTR
ncbi:hypothetical protein M8C13_07125 [Crossiella sp. SN42]|uniref:hypothetical protein n=1 Tax=Crossiella sp. SN42 TaxID=2944808 RepID=UPI00207D4C3D|nr:hypothetical protein [Crossiella sp. SN42]MCO1575529.1 hypothetical protein [Crossiella sp. SN42]